MKIELDIPAEKWGWLVAQGGDPTENLMAKVSEYLDACGRDLGADTESQLLAEIAKRDAVGKAALLASLKGE